MKFSDLPLRDAAQDSYEAYCEIVSGDHRLTRDQWLEVECNELMANLRDAGHDPEAFFGDVSGYAEGVEL